MSDVPAIPRSSPDRRLFFGAALVAALIMVAGFSRTYYLKTVFDTPPLTGLLHLHAFAMTLWFALFIVQVRLVAAGNLGLHRRLGWMAAGLAVILLVLGVAVAIAAARLGHSPGPPPLVFLMLPLSVIFIFVLFTGLAIGYRRRPDVHKRLMLLGTLNMLSPAIARLPGLHDGGPKVFIGLTVFVVLATVGIDTIRNRRLHPAFGWGAGLLILSFPLRMLFAQTELWHRFASWLVAG